MENSYSIEEILSAVSDLHNLKKEKKDLFKKKITKQKSNLDIPKNTLKLIEEAEKVKN